MPSLRERVPTYLHSRIPTKKVTIYRDRFAPQVSVETMGVDRVQSILESAIDGDSRDLFALYRDIILTDRHLPTELWNRRADWDSRAASGALLRVARFPVVPLVPRFTTGYQLSTLRVDCTRLAAYVSRCIPH